MDSSATPDSDVKLSVAPGSGTGFAQKLFDGLAPHYDLLAELLSLGQNRRWREAMVSPVAAGHPRRVLDVATGPAGVALRLADTTDAALTGVDVTFEMLQTARTNVAAKQMSGRINLVNGTAVELPFADEAFDALTFTYLLRYVDDPAATLGELARVVRPGGIISSLEFHVPPAPLWGPLWFAYTRLVLPVAGFVTGGREWFEVGRFLGPSISGHYRRYPTSWHTQAWQEAGIGDVQVRTMSLGGGLVMWGVKTAQNAGPT